MNHKLLVELYNATSKHSHYQILAKPLRNFIPTDKLYMQSRFEQERLDYILQCIPHQGITIADVGGNTGFFTFELIAHGAMLAIFIEGNQRHSAFVQEAATVLGWQDRLKVYCKYISFETDLSQMNVDVCFLLNVLHHVGDDYGDRNQNIESAKLNILSALNRMAQHSRYLVFQLGFNWKGDVHLPLFKNGTKKELIDFIVSGTKSSWYVQNIGIAEASGDGAYIYKHINSKNIQRQDSLGEFLNRPIFILKSLK